MTVWPRRFALGLCLLLFPAYVRAQQTTVLREYNVKAAFLYNLVKYTDWPPRAFTQPDEPIVIGLLGDDPFGDVLDRIVAGRTINGHPIVVRRATGVAELKGAHVVFIGPSEAGRAAKQCAATRLTITARAVRGLRSPGAKTPPLSAPIYTRPAATVGGPGRLGGPIPDHRLHPDGARAGGRG